MDPPLTVCDQSIAERDTDKSFDVFFPEGGGGSFRWNGVTFRGRHYGTNAYPASSGTYSGVELAYSPGAAAIGAAGLVGLAKTPRRLRAVAFGFEHARKIVGDARAQVRVVNRRRDLESSLEVAGGRPPGAPRRGEPRPPPRGPARGRGRPPRAG